MLNLKENLKIAVRNFLRQRSRQIIGQWLILWTSSFAVVTTSQVSLGQSSTLTDVTRQNKPDAKAAKQNRAPSRKSAGSSNTSASRTVIHTEAYKQRAHLGPHVNIKVTPPEKRGAKNRVLVEIYNYSKTYLYTLDFWLYLYSNSGEEVEVHITADDIRPGWSALRWVKIPGNKPIPPITRVVLKNKNLFDEKARPVKLKHYIDLIKE